MDHTAPVFFKLVKVKSGGLPEKCSAVGSYDADSK